MLLHTYRIHLLYFRLLFCLKRSCFLSRLRLFSWCTLLLLLLGLNLNLRLLIRNDRLILTLIGDRLQIATSLIKLFAGGC